MNTFREFRHLTADPPAALVYSRIADLHDAARPRRIEPIDSSPGLMRRMVARVVRARRGRVLPLRRGTASI
ncbi:MAG: hypothetical protein ACOH2Q_12705 [Rhodococcus sp. (in: high G+C Gram-positive bacteria)]